MKYFFLIISIFCCLLQNLFSEKLVHGRHYVHKAEFAELKMSPDMNSKTMAKIPYGARVDIEKEPSPPVYQEDYLKGNIRFATYKKLSGYIFDGYLSKYPTPINRCDNFKSYADESFKRLNSQTKNDSLFKGIVTNYIGGVKHILGKTEKEKFEQLILSNATFKDAFYIARVCAHPAFHGIQYPENGKELSIEMNDMKESKLQLFIKEEKDGVSIIQKELF